MPRSTRNKVRFQIERAAECQDRAIEHLKNATDMADSGSTPINKQMPDLVKMLMSVKGVLLKFRSEL